MGTAVTSSAPDALSASVSAVPIRNNTTYTAHNGEASSSTANPSAPSTTARKVSAATTIRRRSSRSARAPLNNANNNQGSCWMNAAAPTAAGSSVMDATSNGPAASIAPSPRFEIAAAGQILRKSRPSSGGRTELRIGAPDAGRAVAPRRLGRTLPPAATPPALISALGSKVRSTAVDQERYPRRSVARSVPERSAWRVRIVAECAGLENRYGG